MHPFEITQVKAADVPLEHLASNPHVSEAQKVAEATRQFEAMLLRQILKDARKTVFPSPYQPQSAVSDIYHDMISHQLADSISRSGSFGLARALQSQLVREVEEPSSRPTQTAKSPDAATPAAKPIRTKLLQ